MAQIPGGQAMNALGAHWPSCVLANGARGGGGQATAAVLTRVTAEARSMHCVGILPFRFFKIYFHWKNFFPQVTAIKYYKNTLYMAYR